MGPQKTMDIQDMDRLLWVYWSPFTFATGFIGNILVIKIFCFSKTKNITTVTTTIYFIVMAIADATFLLLGIVPEWLEACQFVVLKNIHPLTCKLEKFFFYVSGDVAIWIICVNTMDRFIAVCFPFTQQRFRKAVYAKVASLVTLMLAVGKNLHVFWTRGPTFTESGEVAKVCGRPEQYAYFEYYVRPWIAFALVAVVPCILLMIFNVFIIRFLIREQRRSKFKADFMQTIIMCVAVSAAFVILVTPSLIMYIGKPYWNDGGMYNFNYSIAKAVSNQLSYVNHAINFLLYCITAKKFRDEAIKTILPKCLSKRIISRSKTTMNMDDGMTTTNNAEFSRFSIMKRSLKLIRSSSTKASTYNSRRAVIVVNKRRTDIKDNNAAASLPEQQRKRNLQAKQDQLPVTEELVYVNQSTDEGVDCGDVFASTESVSGAVPE